jgi:hypothetical protein
MAFAMILGQGQLQRLCSVGETESPMQTGLAGNAGHSTLVDTSITESTTLQLHTIAGALQQLGVRAASRLKETHRCYSASHQRSSRRLRSTSMEWLSMQSCTKLDRRSSSKLLARLGRPKPHRQSVTMFSSCLQGGRRKPSTFAVTFFSAIPEKYFCAAHKRIQTLK